MYHLFASVTPHHHHTHTHAHTLLPIFSLCLFTTLIIIILMTSQWPSVLSLFKGYLYLALPRSLNLWPNEMSWHSSVLAVTYTNTRILIHTSSCFCLPQRSIVRWGSSAAWVYSKLERVVEVHWSNVHACVCVSTHTCGCLRKRQRERGEETEKG